LALTHRSRTSFNAATLVNFLPGCVRPAASRAFSRCGYISSLEGLAGLLDELQLHVAPVLLGDGVRLFENHLGPKRREIECTRVIESPAVTHLRYRVVK
jgi:hypothetical protein